MKRSTCGPTAPLLALTAVLALAPLAGCGENGDASDDPGGAPGGEVSTEEGGAVGPAAGGSLPQWQEVSHLTGITAMNHSGKPAQKDWIVSGMGGGTIAFDYDVDGDMDLLIVDGTMLTEDGVLEYSDEMRTRLFRNDGGMKFTEVTKEAGIDIRAFGFGGACCDYDADGFQDVFVATWGRNYLLRNKGDGTFEDVTAAAGVLGEESDMSTSCAWGDVNGDGIHDLYVANYIDQWAFIEHCKKNGLVGRHCQWRGFKVYCGPPGLEPQPDRLYFGRADGTFEEVTETHLVDQKLRYAFTPVMTDIDNDGDLDIYVANDTMRNTLWVNDGEGRFRDWGLESGTALNGDVKEQAGMGVDAADLNRDGLMDLFVTNFSHDFNTLYINNTRRADSPLFRDASHTHQVSRLSYERLCWGTKLFDMDCDTDLDMFVACGHVYGEIDNFAQETGTSYKQKALLLRNGGPPRMRFEDVTEASGPALQIERVWRGATFADFDDDGDIDVFLTALNDKPAMFRNDRQDDNRFLRFRLTGKGTQRDPSGARVYVTLPGNIRMLDELHHGDSFCGDG
ncbi:MAG: FG-GAP repeat domain-containing protein, partial [Planctomycetota bacterium]